MIVLFDLEGTLVETCFERHPEEVESLRRKARIMIQELGIPRDVLSEDRTSSGMRNHALRYAEQNLPEPYKDEIRRGLGSSWISEAEIDGGRLQALSRDQGGTGGSV